MKTLEQKIENLFLDNTTTLSRESFRKNKGTLSILSSYEDFETGDFTEPSMILDSFNNICKEDELNDLFEGAENEDFEISSSFENLDYTIKFASPEAVYVARIQIFYK